MRRVYLPAGLLLLLANTLILTRILVGDVHFSQMKPTIRYYLTLQVEAMLDGDAATIKAYIPTTNEHQTVSSEKVESSRLAYSLISEPPNRRVVWEGSGVSGHELARYDAIIEVHPQTYRLPSGAPIPVAYPDDVAAYLEPTDTIQSDAPEIRAALERLLSQAPDRSLSTTIRVLFDFVHEEIRASDYENTLDAVTTLKWGEAFCGGKSRLLVALLRAARIPARLVGGLILTPGPKRVSHAWVEAWINGVWVPFDALNNHFAEHPRNYLVFDYGDHGLFSRTANINFHYQFNIKKWRTAPDESLESQRATLLNPYVFWEAFRKAHISLNLLRIILLLPVGVLAVVFFRNIVGVTTFGTFHPALMAVAFRETGLIWGMILYVGILCLGLLLRKLLDRIELLHTPRLSIILVFVVVFMLTATYVSVRLGVLEAANVSLFPIAILALTVESFFMKSIEFGARQALSILVQTLAVVATVYLIIDSYFVQAVVFLFPETLLAVVAASLIVGRWTGLRLFEYHRFRLLWAE